MQYLFYWSYTSNQQNNTIKCYKSQFMLILLLIMLPQLLTPYLLNQPHQSHSSFQTLYDSSTKLPQSITNFTVTYQTPFQNIPELIVAISSYTGDDPTFNQLMKIQIQQVTFFGFEISANVSSNTQILFIAIRYFSVDDTNELFEIIHITSEDLVNISVNTDSDRIENIEISVNTMLSEDSIIQPFWRGFWLRSTNGYDFSLSHEVDGENNLTLIVSISRHGYLQLIAISCIIISHENLQNQKLILVESHSFTKSSTLTQTWYNFGSSTATFLVGLTGLYSSSSNRKIIYSLSFLNSSSTMSITNPELFEQIRFSSIIFGQIDCQSKIWLPQSSACVSSCPSGYTQEPLNGYCQQCKQQCRKCSKKPDFCSACFGDLILLQQPGICSQQIFDTRILAVLAVIPCLLLILAFYLAKRKKTRKVDNSQAAQHPSIQF